MSYEVDFAGFHIVQSLFRMISDLSELSSDLISDFPNRFRTAFGLVRPTIRGLFRSRTGFGSISEVYDTGNTSYLTENMSYEAENMSYVSENTSYDVKSRENLSRVLYHKCVCLSFLSFHCSLYVIVRYKPSFTRGLSLPTLFRRET